MLEEDGAHFLDNAEMQILFRSQLWPSLPFLHGGVLIVSYDKFLSDPLKLSRGNVANINVYCF